MKKRERERGDDNDVIKQKESEKDVVKAKSLQKMLGRRAPAHFSRVLFKTQNGKKKRGAGMASTVETGTNYV